MLKSTRNGSLYILDLYVPYIAVLSHTALGQKLSQAQFFCQTALLLYQHSGLTEINEGAVLFGCSASFGLNTTL